MSKPKITIVKWFGLNGADLLIPWHCIPEYPKPLGQYYKHRLVLSGTSALDAVQGAYKELQSLLTLYR